jgi:gamma-glutamylcyclotransferase (GGCT)/AIG2-like uncharacterized protein YtfP|tara:strand:+ start:3336 stop:3668 length:333 start_codon:yes stop_codon:yes gene_type:complete
MLLFVYGTLKKGRGNDGLLSTSKFVGFDKLKGKLFDLGGCPGYLNQGESEVMGEVYEINHPTLMHCDVLEGHPHCYKREILTTNGGLKVWVYIYPENRTRENTIIPSGEW